MDEKALLETEHKMYVEVLETRDRDGVLTPLAIKWTDGRKFAIDRVTDIRKAASLKAGGAGLRYTVRIGAATRFMFLEEERGVSRWFMESLN
jgi:hypothetical protein